MRGTNIVPKKIKKQVN